MEIDQQDMQFVGKVLTGTIQLEQLAKKYSSREAAVTAVVILHAVGQTAFARRSDYEELLHILCVEPALRFNKHGLEPWKDFRQGIKFHRGTLVKQTRECGLYKSSGSVGRGQLVPNTLISELLQDGKLKAFAQQLYDQALAAHQVRQEVQEKYQAKLNRFWDELRSLNPMYSWRSVDDLRERFREAIAIIDKYFPEA